jgi:hypothetical protein
VSVGLGLPVHIYAHQAVSCNTVGYRERNKEKFKVCDTHAW